MGKHFSVKRLILLTSIGLGSPAVAVEIETVVIGNPGNPGEQSRLSNGDSTFYGGVAYTFSMGKYEVTAGQYTEFLNAVAATDTYGLYHVRMDYDADPTRNGCNIKRQGSSGSYTYSVAPDWANRPVNWVSYADAIRFANWLHNGQPTGAQGLATTEDGSYFINGIGQFNDGALEDVLREPDATWVIPTDNEWYKAAFHKNDGVTGNYWNYGTGSDAFPSNDLIDPDPGNNATYHTGVFGDPAGYTIGAPYYRTESGAHANSSSAYGTFDQAGNVMEFTETIGMIFETRRMRDGSWKANSGLMGSSQIDDVMHSSDQFDDLGFRLATLVVPPACSTFVAPDFDEDCDVDSDDLDTFIACASGPSIPFPQNCNHTDFDEDGDTDQNDFAAFQLCVTGAGLAPDPSCAG